MQGINLEVYTINVEVEKLHCTAKPFFSVLCLMHLLHVLAGLNSSILHRDRREKMET